MKRNLNFVLDNDPGPLTADYFGLLPRTVLLDMGGGGADFGESMGTLGAAQQYSQQATRDAVGAIRGAFDTAAGYVAPWRDVGGGAVRQWGSFLGVPGAGGTPGVDQTAMLQNWPGLQFLQERGADQMARYGAASGLAGSGAALRGAQDYGQKLALTYALQPYLSNLSSLSGQGLQAGTATGGWSMQSGLGQGQAYQTGAQQNAGLAAQLAQMQQQQALAEAQSSGSFWNDILSGVGMVGSLALTPFSGGTSLAGMAGKGLSGLFGGAGAAAGAGSLIGTSNAFTPAAMGYGGGGFASLPWKAEGGPVYANRPAIVGERGPEIFVPDQPGYIVPNHALPLYAQEYSAFTPWRRAA